MNTNDMLKELRLFCKNKAATFKKCSHTVNGSPVYKVISRESGRFICGDFNINMAYENMLSGYIGDQI